MKHPESLKYRIPVRQQILLIETLVAAAQAIEAGERQVALTNLSRVATFLEDGAAWTEMTHFFDLGEWLQERADTPDQSFDPSEVTWAGEAHRSLQASLEVLRKLSP